jgi:hypothetical protein
MNHANDNIRRRPKMFWFLAGILLGLWTGYLVSRLSF